MRNYKKTLLRLSIYILISIIVASLYNIYWAELPSIFLVGLIMAIFLFFINSLYLKKYKNKQTTKAKTVFLMSIPIIYAICLIISISIIINLSSEYALGLFFIAILIIIFLYIGYIIFLLEILMNYIYSKFKH